MKYKVGDTVLYLSPRTFNRVRAQVTLVPSERNPRWYLIRVDGDKHDTATLEKHLYPLVDNEELLLQSRS